MHRLISVIVALTFVCATGPLSAQEALFKNVRSGGPSIVRTESTGTIQGNALTATNGQLSDAVIRLRDARAGRVVDLTRTDRAGVFVFHGVEPGSYLVEIVGNDDSILAASEILNVNTGDMLTTFVKLPLRIPPAAGVFGHTVGSALAIAATAAAAGVLATQVVGQDVSPRR